MAALAMERARHDRLVESVTRLLELHARAAAAKTPHDRTVLEVQISATDRQINNLVYELYALNGERGSNRGDAIGNMTSTPNARSVVSEASPWPKLFMLYNGRV